MFQADIFFWFYDQKCQATFEIDDEKIGKTSTGNPKQTEQQVHSEQLQIIQYIVVQKEFKKNC